MDRKDYRQFYEDYVREMEETHAHNTKKIRSGLRINIILPLVFLVLCFLIGTSKLVFLILWIVSLFGIAFYLVYVEYTDYKMQIKLKNLKEREENTDPQVDALIGDKVAQAQEQVSGRMDEIDENRQRRREETVQKIEARREAVAEKIEEQKAEVAEHLEERRAQAAEHLDSIRQRVGHLRSEGDDGAENRNKTGSSMEQAPKDGYSSEDFENALAEAIEREEDKNHA